MEALSCVRLWSLLAIGACATGAQPPLLAPGQVIALDDGVLRTRADQTIEIFKHLSPH